MPKQTSRTKREQEAIELLFEYNTIREHLEAVELKVKRFTMGRWPRESRQRLEAIVIKAALRQAILEAS